MKDLIVFVFMRLFAIPVNTLGLKRLVSITSSCWKLSQKRRLFTNFLQIDNQIAKRSRLNSSHLFQVSQTTRNFSSNYSPDIMSDIAELEEQVKKCRISVREQVNHFTFLIFFDLFFVS